MPEVCGGGGAPHAIGIEMPSMDRLRATSPSPPLFPDAHLYSSRIDIEATACLHLLSLKIQETCAA